MFMRKIDGTVNASPLPNGGKRIVIVAKTGEQIGIDVSPEKAAELVQALAATSNPPAEVGA